MALSRLMALLCALAPAAPVTALLLGWIPSGFVQPAIAQPQYQLVIHPPPPDTGYTGSNRSYATGINDLRQTVTNVIYQRNGEQRAVGVIYDQAGGYTVLPNLGGSFFSPANGINNLGWTAGSSALPGLIQQATLWNGTTLTGLPAPAGNFSNAWDLNDSGVVVGEASTTSGANWATVWNTQSGVVVQIPPSPGRTSSNARAINNAGQVVGTSYNGGSRAFLYQNGSAIDLTTGAASSASGINGLGTVTGNAENASGRVHAVLWNTALNMSFIPGIDPLAIGSGGIGINDSGLIVGQVNFPGAITSGFLHNSLTGQTWDVNTLIQGGLPANTWVSTVTGINSFGDISGTVVIGDRLTGTRYAATLYAVPAPGALFTLSLGSIAASRRRRSTGGRRG